MAPVEMRLENKNQEIGKLDINPGKKQELSPLLKYVEGYAYCNQFDTEGTVLFEGDPKVVRAERITGVNGLKVGVVKPGETARFNGQISVRISSPYYNESVVLTHKKAPARREVGRITSGHQKV